MSNEIPTSDELQTLLDKLVGDSDCPGASAAVSQGDNVSVAASGVLNLNTGVEVTTDSIFQIGSNTKVYNATMVMQLVDEGKVDLDEPAVTYLPEFKLADAAATKQITVRHLITHTSGIDGGDYIEDFGRGDDAIAKFVASLKDVGLVSPIGKFHSYCNAATVVAGRIIEVLSGLTWHEALKTKLLQPLGLDHTVSLPEEALLFRTSAGHLPDPNNDDKVRVFPVWMLPHATAPAGASICASATDLVDFGRMHLRNGMGVNGTRVLSEASATAMREPQFPDVENASPNGGQGLGWIMAQQGPFTMVMHGGGTFGQVSQFVTLPKQDAVVAVLTNGPGAVGAGVLKEVLSRLGGDEFAATLAAAEAAAKAAEGDDAATAPAPQVDIDLEKYVGVYERTSLQTTVDLQDGGLVAQTVLSGYVAQLPPQKPSVLKPVSPTTFLMLDDKGKPSGQATFADLDDDGRPTYLIMGRVSRRVS